ncbi:MAG: hypothetical protein HXY29_14650 [Rhodocyclaceae bacterium]|nr:hypothetical protein [Rhodocyclaceae bacterium]
MPNALRKFLARAERGEGSLVELIGVIVVLVALLDIAVCIVIARPAQVAAPSPSGAPGNARVGLSYGWARWGTVACTVQVDVPTGAIGIMRRIVGSPTLTITQSTTLTDGAWQSRW